MALGYLIQPFIQIQDINGNPVVGARVYVYEADTTDFAVTYRDFEGHRNENPIITDELGNFTVVADSGIMYDIVINDADDNLLFSKKQLSVNFAGESGLIDIQAGTGISVDQSGNTYIINVDTDYIATQEDLATKQDRLYAGDNISIVDNIISSSYHDTTYTATAPIAIDSSNNISIMLGTGLTTQNSSLALDTSYIATQANLGDYLRMDHIVAGANMSITNNSSYITFAATDTTYTFSTGLTENAGIVIVDNPVPTASSSDNGKVLGVTNSLGNIGWVSLPADELPSIAGNSGKVLKVNSGATGVEWATDQNTTYSAGTGLTLNSTTFSADTTVLATKTDLAGKQDKLTAGSNITISNNVISATDTTYTFSTGLAESSGTVTVVNPVPNASSSDNGKVLGVTDNQGTLGWVSQPSDELPSISGNSGKVLKVNSGATGVEWATDQNTTYSAGTGLTLNGTTFAADTTVLATKTDLAGKQDKLTAGTNITISNNVISSTDTIESIKLNGTALTITNKSVDIPLATTSAPGAMSATDKSTISNLATVATSGSYNDLTNIPANLVQDAAYVHTDNNFTNTLKTKLDGIQSGAEVNVQANWSQTDNTADDYIKNKPDLSVFARSADLATVATTGNYNDLSYRPTFEFGLYCTHDYDGTDHVGIDLDTTVPGLIFNNGKLRLVTDSTLAANPNIPFELGVKNPLPDSPTGSTQMLLYYDGNGSLGWVASGDYLNKIESVKLNGTALSITNKSVDIPLATTSSPGAMSASDKTTIGNLKPVATTGSYNDLTDTPSIPAAQVQSDWNQGDNTKVDYIKNKPTIPAALSAGDGIGISSNVISRKVQFVTTSSTYSTIRHVLDEGDVPVLDVANGSYHNYFFPTHKSGTHVDFIGSMGYSTYPTYEGANYMLKYSVDNYNAWTVTKYHELPDYTSSDASKALAVNSSGNGVEWVNNLVPAYTSSDQYKVLSVSYNGNGTQWRDVREVPSYAVVNQGYLLGVVNNGGNIELGWTQPTGYWTQAVDNSGNHTLTADDIAVGYVDFETAITASNTTSATTNPTYAALSWDVRVASGSTSSVVSSVDFALGISGGSYETIFSDNSPAHEVHKDWGITSAWMLNYRKNRVRARCNLASGATVGNSIIMNCGGIVIQVR